MMKWTYRCLYFKSLSASDKLWRSGLELDGRGYRNKEEKSLSTTV